MKDAVDFAVHFFESKKIRRILIGGTDENVKQFRGFLPKAWHSLVIGSFPISLTANPVEVQARALEVSVQVEERREADLVDNLLASAAKPGSAVTGLDATLDAANQGRVQILVVTEGLRKVGYRAKENGSLVHKLPAENANGADGFEKVYDVVDLAVNAVLRSGGEVEVVQQNEALDKAGSIGALLRY
jgi:peptide subunit release factor 1 (eRF1)